MMSSRYHIKDVIESEYMYVAVCLRRGSVPCPPELGCFDVFFGRLPRVIDWPGFLASVSINSRTVNSPQNLVHII